MDKTHYQEMVQNLDSLCKGGELDGKEIFLFGHCNASEELFGLLSGRGYMVGGFLDNSPSKQGGFYKGARILPPEAALGADAGHTVVCIASRAYEAMAGQLAQMGYRGRVEKLVDYNTFAEYSLSADTVARKTARLQDGMQLLGLAKGKYPGSYQLYCPFCALGDVYYAMAYLPYFLRGNKIEKYVVFTVGQACAKVAGMFGAGHVEALGQEGMDRQVQAVLYTDDKNAFIMHHDRPYTVGLHKVLYVKELPLELMYKHGVFGLGENARPSRPVKLKKYGELEEIPEGRAAILSPYAKSTANIPEGCWGEIVAHFRGKGCRVYTNVAGGEEALPGTTRLEVPLDEMQSVAERAGTFIGLRSGLCDVLKWADCRKVALYPDCFYSDTRWKVEEIFHLEGWENIVVA